MRIPATEPRTGPMPATRLLAARSRLLPWQMALLLALVTIALYWPATRCDFINLDDPDYVTDNPHVQGGLSWDGVKWAFGNTDQAVQWAPLMWLSHMLEAIRLKPDYALAHMNLGIALFKQGHTDEAIHQLQEAIRFKPQYALAYINLGAAYFNLGKTDEAIGQFQEAIHLDSGNTVAQTNLAKALEMKSKSNAQ